VGWSRDFCISHAIAQMTRRKKLIVIGGGASGFFCAVNAARLHKDFEVVILEKTTKLLSKVKVSGGGRCNVTHASEEVEDMLHAYPRGMRLLKKTLHQFSPMDTIQWFEERGVTLKEESDGRMFPVSNNSQSIIDCLLSEASKHAVKINTSVEVISVVKTADHFLLEVTDVNKTKTEVTADYVCIASGGYPKLSGFDWLTSIGHTISEPVPSLFTFNIPDKKLHALMGVSVKHAVVKIPFLKVVEEGPLLITHWGLSGPAVLKLSSRCARDLNNMNYEFDVCVNWLPDYHESGVLEYLKGYKQNAKGTVGAKQGFGLVSRLWDYLLTRSTIDPTTDWGNLPHAQLVLLSKTLCNDLYQAKGKTTFKEEFVTAGGIALQEIDANTMESKKVQGLYFAGEVMDVDGITGGYNFQHAWTSGWIVANSIT
jgi:predicted Rossmann fold flavoprotein